MYVCICFKRLFVCDSIMLEDFIKYYDKVTQINLLNAYTTKIRWKLRTAIFGSNPGCINSSAKQSEKKLGITPKCKIYHCYSHLSIPPHTHHRDMWISKNPEKMRLRVHKTQTNCTYECIFIEFVDRKPKKITWRIFESQKYTNTRTYIRLINSTKYIAMWCGELYV